MPEKKQEHYHKIHEIWKKRRDELMETYNFLVKKKKARTPYYIFFKKRYNFHCKDGVHIFPEEISKVISQEWKKLSDKDKDRLKDESEKEK